MPKNTRILTDIAFKKLANATITNPGNSEFQETIKTNIQLGANTIFSKTPPSTGLPSTLYNTSSDGFVQYVELDLVAVGSSNYDADTFSGDSSNYDDVDSGQGVIDHAYAAKLPAAYETEDGGNSDSNSQNPKAGTGFFTNGTFLSGSGGTVQIVPPSFGTGYIPVVEDSNGNNPSLGGDSQDFYIDYYSGVVFRQDKASDNSYPVKLKCYIYISDFVTDSLDSAGDTVDLHISASEGTGFSIANAATASFESGSAGVTVTAGATNKITIGASTDNVTFSEITASAGITSSGAIEATAFIASASAVGTTGFIFRDPTDDSLLNNRITLTSARNMQFRAGGIFQFYDPLHLEGGQQLRFSDTDNTSRFRIQNVSANTGSGDQNNTTLAIKNMEGTALINISGSGKVGINRTPFYDLDVGGAARFAGNTFVNQGGLFLSHSSADGGIGSVFEAPTTQLHTLRFDSERFRIWAGGLEIFTVLSASGNVGIQQQSPTEALELGTGKKIKLVGATNTTGSIIFNTSDTQTLFSSFNTSAGDPKQFEIRHNYHATELYNHRGHIILSGSSGNSVAINTGSAATQGLTVQGNISASGFISTSGGFYGDGSTLSNVVVTNLTDSDEQIIQGSLRLTHNIIAENYIVSSSVTYMTQSFSDGSTIFGDSLTDTHQFTGSLLITGSTTKMTFDGEDNIIKAVHNDGSEGDLRLQPEANLYLGDNSTNNVYIGRQNNASYETVIYDGTSTEALKIGKGFAEINVPLTASSNISASSFISASDLYLTDTLTALDGGVTAKSHGSVELEVDGNITSSGYIMVTHSNSPHIGGFVLDRDGSDQYRLEHLDGGLTIVNRTDSSRKEMTFNGTGRVGIGVSGTPSTTSTLTVSGSISGSGQLELREDYTIDLDPGTGGPRLKLGSIADNDSFMDFGAYNSINNLNTKARDFHIFGTNTTTGFYFDESAGRFGIGTTAPSQKLEVRGNIHLSGSNNQTRQIEIKSSGSGATRSQLVLRSWRVANEDYGDSKLYKSGSQTFLDTDEDFRIRPNNNGAFRVGGGMGNIYFTSQSNGTEDVADEVTYFFGDVENKRIGIGAGSAVTAPSSLLHLSSSTSNGIRIETDNAANSNGAQLFIQGNKLDSSPSRTTIIELKGSSTVRARGIEFTSTDDDSERWYAGTIYNQNGYTIGHTTDSTKPEYAASSSFFIDNQGKVGINTTTPNYLLDIESGSSDLGMRLYNTTDDQNTSLRFVAKGTTGANRIWFGDTANAQIGGIIYRHNGNSLAFDVNSSERVRINSAGKVGIGTTNPPSELTVVGDISSSANLYVSKSIFINGGGGYNDATIEVKNDSLDLKDHGNIRLAMDSDGGGGPRTIQFGTGSAGAFAFQSLMTISGSGKVGIGTTTPGTELEVIGDVSASGLLYASSSDANGTTYQIALVDTASGLFYTTASEAISPTTAESASSVTVTDNADTDAAQAIIFAEPNTGDGVSLQSDATTFTYNPGESGGELQIGATSVLAINEGEIDTSNTTFDLLNDTATTINFGGDATTLNIGAATGTVTINGSASIAGDLIVQGTTTSINTDQLNVEDPFILLNSSSADPASDGGIIVQTDGSSNGTALFYDNSSNRWAIAESSSVAWNVGNDTAVAHQYVVSVSQSAAAPSGNPGNFGLDDASRYGMMYVDTSDTSGDGGLYIYLP